MKLTSTNRLRLVAITLTTFLTLGIGSFASVSTFKGDQGRIDSQVNETIQAAKENVGQELSAALFYIDQYSLDLSLLLLSRDGQLTLISESTKEGLERLSLSEANRAVREIYDARGKSHLRLRTLEISGGDYLVVVGSAEDAYKRLQSNIATSISITVVANLGAFIILSFYIRKIKRRDDVDALARMREFLGDASHELRTPLTVIKGYVEMLSKGMMSEESDKERAFLRVNNEIARMEILIHDLLLLGELGESGERSKERVDFSELLRAYADDFVTLNPGRKVIIQIQDDISINADRDYLARYIQNALVNITRHTPPHSPVRISLTRKNKSTRLAIEDGGPGLPQSAYRENIRSLNRFDASRSRDHGGSGLGMSIMAGVVAKLGGTFSLQPSDLGGLAVIAELP